MILTSHPEVAGKSRKPHPSGSIVTEFIGNREVTSDEPSTHLVEIPPGFVITPHFHGTNQYQLVVDGSCTLGKASLYPGAFQYSDAYTPYGPIVAGEDGLAFFTLRQTAYAGFHEMPGSKALMNTKAGRNFISAADPNRARKTDRVELHLEPGGPCSYELIAAPHDMLPISRHAHGGTYLAILAGEVSFSDVRYPSRSVIWFGGEDPVPNLKAGAEGSIAVQLSFPLLRTVPTAKVRNTRRETRGGADTN
jgi:hypothetical protein